MRQTWQSHLPCECRRHPLHTTQQGSLGLRVCWSVGAAQCCQHTCGGQEEVSAAWLPVVIESLVAGCVLHMCMSGCRWWVPSVVPEFKLDPYPNVVKYVDR